jgi:hypothetical protein
VSVSHLQNFHISFLRDLAGIDFFFASQELQQSLCRFETFTFNGCVTRFVDGYCGIAYHKRIVISSETVLFIEEMSVV